MSGAGRLRVREAALIAAVAAVLGVITRQQVTPNGSGVRRALDARMCRADQRWWGGITGLAVASAAFLTLARRLTPGETR